MIVEKPENRISRSSGSNRGRRHKRRRHSGAKNSRRTPFQRFAVWLKKNPLKIAALIFISVIIYVSLLFVTYEKDFKNKKDSISNDKSIKGVLLPMRILSEISLVLLDFGGNKISVSLAELKHGYLISPMSIKNCANLVKSPELVKSDPTKFVITLVNDRIYLTANFISVLDNKKIASLNQKEWSYLSKDIPWVRTDDYSFEIMDNHKNVMFSLQFVNPNIIRIRGYFVGADCILIANNDEISVINKTGDYINKTLSEIKNIKKLW